MLDAPDVRIRGSARAGVLVALAALYYLSAKLGLSLGVAEQVSAVWPPSGIALAALLLLGTRYWPGIWLGALAANLEVSEPLGTALGIATGNTLEALAGTWILEACGLVPSLGRLRDVLSVVLAAVVSTAIAASAGVVSLCLGGVQPWARFGALWEVWWLGDTLGVLLITPLLLVWSSTPRRPWTARRLAELVVVAAGLAWSTELVFSVPEAAPESPPLAYIVFPFVIWSALRFGQHGTTVALLIAAAVGTWATALGGGPFGFSGVEQPWLYLQGFMGVLAVTGLLLGAAVAERDRIERHRAAEHAVTRVLAEGRDVAATRSRILQVLCESFRFDVGAFWIASEESSVLRCVEFWHVPGVSVPAFAEETRRRTFSPGVGLPGRVWAAAKPAWIEDVVRDTNFPRAPIAARENLHGALAFPIVLGDQVLGALEFFSRDSRRADARLMQLLGSIGSHIGQFLERKSAEAEEARLLAAEHDARRKAEELAADLREQQSAKDRFLAMLGHELRNPLAPITHAVQVLRLQETAGFPSAALHEIMERQLRHMNRLVDDLLDLSRIGKGTIGIRREPVDLCEVVRRVVETHRTSIEERGHVLTLALPDEPVPVHGDATRLDQVVANLLHNAARYTPPGGTVTVTLERSDPDGLVRVRDTGIGIRAEELERIFDAFTQADRVPGSVNEGLGLGLALVRQIATLHEGSAHARSEGPGRGSEFVVRIPLTGDAAPGTEGLVRQSSARAGARPRHVLIVDDNRDLAGTLATILRMKGHRVSIAHDGATALSQVREARPDVVLLDIEMPGGMDGYEVARRMHGMHESSSSTAPASSTATSTAGELGLHLVALTGYGSTEDKRRAREAGFEAHLVKPVEPAVLLALIDELGPRE